jgi:hypothetical protein
MLFDKSCRWPNDYRGAARLQATGDPVSIVADNEAIRAFLISWALSYDDIEFIVGHALAWERKLMSRTDVAGDPVGTNPYVPILGGVARSSHLVKLS